MIEPAQQQNQVSDPQLQRLRFKDLITGLVLAIVGLVILWQASHYPNSQTWGGVSNVWYTSPALMPLLTGGILVALAIVLMLLSLKDCQFSSSTIGQLWNNDSDRSKSIRRLLVISLLAGYVYVLIPFSDFYLATMVFQFTITSQFYLPKQALTRAMLWLFYATNIGLLIIIAFSDHIDTENPLFLADALTLAVAGLFLWLCFLAYQEQQLRTKIRNMTFSCVLLPLLLVLIFKYLLLVPMPTEGVIISLFDWLHYDLLGR